MKEFLVGLLFLAVVLILAGIGFLMFPFLVILGLFLRLALMVIFVILCIWLVGKLIVYIWQRLNENKKLRD
jgi:hypothetical protein